MQAYTVDEEIDSTVVFAETEVEAAQIGASELWSDPEFVKVKRSPEYDQYTHLGYVPIKALYDDNWWFECWECLQQIPLEDDDEGNSLEPVFEEKKAFCSKECQQDFYALREVRLKQHDEAKQQLLKRLPKGIEITSCYGGGHHPIRIRFTFPGGKHPVGWVSDSPKTLLVKVIDDEAWQTFSSKKA